MTTAFHAWAYIRFAEIQSNLRRKELHRTNQGSNFLGASFINRDNVRALIQFRKESQLQHLKRWFFLKKRCTHSHINSTSVIRLIKWNKLSFYIIYFNKPLPALNQCLVDQIQAQKPILAVATDQMPDHTWIESSIISIDSNIKTTSSGGATCWTIFL